MLRMAPLHAPVQRACIAAEHVHKLWSAAAHALKRCRLPVHYLSENSPAGMMQNLVAGQPEIFKQQLHQMWFSFYSRSNVRDDTCGFEHGASTAHVYRALKKSLCWVSSLRRACTRHGANAACTCLGTDAQGLQLPSSCSLPACFP